MYDTVCVDSPEKGRYKVVVRNYLNINALTTFRVAVFTTLISVNHLIVCDLLSTPKWNHSAIHFSTVRV